MKKVSAPSRNFLFAILVSALSSMIIYGCAPKVYVNSYSDPEFKFSEIKKVAIVLENSNKINFKTDMLFAEMFTQAAVEKQRFFLVQKNYIKEKEVSNPDCRADVDGVLKIALTQCYPGSRTHFLPTSVGAYAKLVETRTGKMVWNMNYAYSSSSTGSSAPLIEEVMKIVVDRLVDSVPLKYTVPSIVGLEKHKDAAPEVIAEEPAPDKEEPVLVESPHPFENGPFLIHAASVRVERRDIAEEFIDRKTDGTLRLAILVDLRSKGLWYRLMIGRFKTHDACQSYLGNVKQSFEIDKDAHPVKLPFSLLISSGQDLASSRSIAKALRDKHFLAYLCPPAGKAETYDVLFGAYESEEEAAVQAKVIFQNNGILPKVISP
ncbi:MAG: hypothetical protein JRE23_09270 [Deltaproteobacteria bacterium]|nr:hypothetical protein [Deltaproteobacteria bacterium]